MYDKITALYCRYSRDDGQETENASITHQKALLKEYAENNGYPNLRYYVDDGYTGTNFNRPDFQRMMEDVENGIIETIVVKDNASTKLMTNVKLLIQRLLRAFSFLLIFSEKLFLAINMIHSELFSIENIICKHHKSNDMIICLFDITVSHFANCCSFNNFSLMKTVM